MKMRAAVLATNSWRLLPLWCLVAVLAPTGAAHGDDDALDGDVFQAGRRVVLEQTVGGDALLAGATVESNASIDGDASLAGGRVVVRATVGQDLYAAAGQLEIDALVHGNARLAGGRVLIHPESRIEGGVAIAGATVDARGDFGGYLTVAGGDVTLGGEVDGDVHVYAERLTVLPGTRIGGELRYRVSGPVSLPEDLEVDAGVIPEEGDAAAAGPGLPAMLRNVGWLWLTGLFVLGLLLVRGLAGFSRRSSAALAARPWFGMAVGLLVLAGVPALAMALALSVVGLPLALLLVLGYLALLLTAYVTGALYLGDRALAATGPGRPAGSGRRLLALLLVLLGLALVGSLPVLGGLLRFAVLLLGLGGSVLALWGGPPAAGGGSAVPAAGASH